MTLKKWHIVQLGLSSDPKWGDISNYPALANLSHEQARLLSLGFGDDPTIKDISNVFQLWKLTDAECTMLSKWQIVKGVRLESLHSGKLLTFSRKGV